MSNFTYSQINIVDDKVEGKIFISGGIWADYAITHGKLTGLNWTVLKDTDMPMISNWTKFDISQLPYKDQFTGYIRINASDVLMYITVPIYDWSTGVRRDYYVQCCYLIHQIVNPLARLIERYT